MTATTADIDTRAAGLGQFEKWLSVWVGGAILAGIALGNAAPELFSSLAAIEYASVNLVVAVLIWAMIFPMMVAVDFGAVRRVGDKPKGLIITLVVNWLIKPFTMAALHSPAFAKATRDASTVPVPLLLNGLINGVTLYLFVERSVCTHSRLF